MRIDVKLFGPQVEVLGQRVMTVELPDQATCRDLKAALAKQHSKLSGCRVAINHEFADDATVLHESDDVALIGQVSGG